MMEEDAMTTKQLRGECLACEMRDEPILDPFVYDYGKSGHVCPHCGIGLSTVECSNGCPHVLTCEEYMEHESAGTHWCPIERVD